MCNGMRVFVVLLGLMLIGCQTQAPKDTEIRTPTPDRLVAYQSKADGDATIVVTRDVGFTGGACLGDVFIDGRVVAKLDTGERAAFHVPSGNHVVGTWNTGSGLCGYRVGTDRKEVSVDLRPGDIRKFRISINPDSGPEINATTL